MLEEDRRCFQEYRGLKLTGTKQNLFKNLFLFCVLWCFACIFVCVGVSDLPELELLWVVSYRGAGS